MPGVRIALDWWPLVLGEPIGEERARGLVPALRPVIEPVVRGGSGPAIAHIAWAAGGARCGAAQLDRAAGDGRRPALALSRDGVRAAERGFAAQRDRNAARGDGDVLAGLVLHPFRLRQEALDLVAMRPERLGSVVSRTRTVALTPISMPLRTSTASDPDHKSFGSASFAGWARRSAALRRAESTSSTSGPTSCGFPSLSVIMKL